MKKLNLLVMMFMMMVNMSFGQSILKGDMDDDGKLTIKDVTALVETINGKTAEKSIKVDTTPIKLASGESIWLSFENGVIKLNCSKEETYYTVKVTHSEGGTASANPTSVVSGGKVTLTATPNAGYTFDGWYSGTTKVSGNATYSITVTTNLTLEAKFNKVTTNDVIVYVGQWQGLKSVFNATPIDELIANATPHTFSDTLALDFTATKNTFYFIYPTDKVECTKFQFNEGILNDLLDGNVYNISRTDGNYTTLGCRDTTITEDNPLTYNIAFKTK